MTLAFFPVVAGAVEADSLAAKGIVFTGVVEDSSFAAGEKLNVEILESGEAVQTVVGKSFQVILPDDTLWNVCVTNSDTAGAEKEKCYELVYTGMEKAFSKTLGDGGLTDGANAMGDSLPDNAQGTAAGNLVQGTAATSENIAQGTAPGDSGSVVGMTQNGAAGVAADSALKKSAQAGESSKDSVDVDALLAAGNNGRVTEMKKVVVQLRRRPKRKPGESVVSAKSIKRMPGLAEADVIRSIQALPGVVASSDFSTKIYVRGGAADQNLFLFDNAVVYSPTHFFGLFSTFLVEGIDDVQFYKSGFPAQYGNRLSSVLKMEGRAGGEDSVQEWFSKSSIKISTFAAQLHTEGHKGNARWVLAGRTTYIGYMLDLLNALDVIDLNLDYEFTDLQGTFIYDFDENNRLKFSFYSGKDELDFSPLKLDWGNIAVPINFYHRFDGDWDYNATFAFSRFYQEMKVSSLINIAMNLYTISGKQWVNYRGIDFHTLTVGYELEYDYDRFAQKIASMRLCDKQQPFHHVVYAQDAWRLDPDLLWQFGLRFNYQTLAHHFGVEPRTSLNIDIDETKSLEIYGGYYLQYMNSVMFSDGESLNEFYYPATETSKGNYLKPASSWLIAAEYKQSGILDRLDASAAVYYKTQSNLNTYAMKQDSTEENSSDDYVLADGFGTADGYSMGYELSLRKDKGWWFGGINWSQSLSVMRANDGSKAYFPSWHQPYALKMDLGINWKGNEESIWPHKKKGRYFRSSVILKYSAGMPITDYVGYYYVKDIDDALYENDMAVIPDSRNASRQTDYFRIDVKAIDMGRENKWNFSWTIINLTDHENMFYTFYDTSKEPPKKSTSSQFPFLPIMLSYEYYF